MAVCGCAEVQRCKGVGVQRYKAIHLFIQVWFGNAGSQFGEENTAGLHALDPAPLDAHQVGVDGPEEVELAQLLVEVGGVGWQEGGEGGVDGVELRHVPRAVQQEVRAHLRGVLVPFGIKTKIEFALERVFLEAAEGTEGVEPNVGLADEGLAGGEVLEDPVGDLGVPHPPEAHAVPVHGGRVPRATVQDLHQVRRLQQLRQATLPG